MKKRSERRVEIQRPKKGITFDLDKNMEREFRDADIVQQDDTILKKSSERSTPSTSSRLVKFKQPTEGEKPTAEETEEASRPVAGSVDGELLETQSG